MCSLHVKRVSVEGTHLLVFRVYILREKKISKFAAAERGLFSDPDKKLRGTSGWVLPYMMEHFYEERLSYVASFDILNVVQLANGSNQSIAVDSG